MDRISHTNLLKLYGFCFADDIKALVYECMENGSFDKILYKNPNSVEWAKLYDIALQIARGLAYLHNGCGEQIIHHDVKAANVLLDKSLCPKITDFGVSKLMKSDVTHLTNTRTRGTDYYSAPEIHQPLYPITCKCDVYSFGLMLFEILGRRCHIPKNKIWFPHEVSQMLSKQPETIMEYCGIMEKDREKAMIVLMVAMWCAQYTPAIRPSMKDVVEVLEKEMSVTTPPYPFQSHNSLGHSMLPSLQGIPEVHPEVPVNDKSLAISCPTPVVVPHMLITAYRVEENKQELEEYISKEHKGLKKYSLMDLQKFTSWFSNMIACGGFREVYKGRFPDGVEVAIKVFADGDIGKEMFMSEMRAMSTLYHKNILRAYGYCLDKKMMALIYEYMPYGSLDNILYGNHRGIEWGRLYGIVIEIAKGVSYLHEGHHHRTIHLDLKPRSVLLDENLCPKIKTFDSMSHITLTSPKRTRGYAAPEMWMSESPVTSEADVYSFGTIMFEVLGMRNNNQPGQRWFPQYVWEKFETEDLEELIEELGIPWENREDAKRLSMIALWCVQYTPRKRPSIGTVVKMLEKTLPVTPPPMPFQVSLSVVDEVDDDDVEEEEESESMLELYEKKCPPGGENSVIIYTTTIERMKRSFKESNYVRKILQSHHIKMIERDIPVLFVKGRLIGAADEVQKLEAEGKLQVLLYGIPTED
ncbi:hypothetical protein AQUCO_02800225v1 [Aquilegia coerulea]|uniref:Protein kinase domain-containing protein n=1 Tax=Aquilegia coerulea TaxID=218851 RepID=A0A2G5D4E7_AQUCA|nr:hypothetical protein AQUCO_02800225v1 [Aquilegia coerulea]